MRSLRLLLLILLMLVAEAMMAETVDMARARQAATTFLNNNGARTRGLDDVTPTTGFSNVYVFTTENSFVLMAADDRVQPILGYSLTSGFDIENMPENKRAWIEGYSKAIQYSIEHQTRASTEVTQQWRDLVNGHSYAGRTTTVVAPLLQTQWSQDAPYNMLCPGGSVTGCVATAMAQIMKYWNYPEHGIGSHSYTHATYGELTADFQSTIYDWTNMANTYDSTSTETQITAVATLMYHCGVSVDMNYSPDGSGAASAIVADALKDYFNYSLETVYYNRSRYDDNVWLGMLKADLDLSRPIWYRGLGAGGGHAFVFDGYNSDDYFHVNWGWEGTCDEYYAINNLNPGPGGTGSGSYGIYNNDQGAVFGIHPSECTADAPTNLTYSQNGRDVTLSWSAAAGASSYKVFRNNRFIGDASSISYTDTVPYGSSVYYVRSVDSLGILSLSSSTVTVTVAYSTPVINDLAATVSGKNVDLTWSAPDWCYPETPTATMTYGNGNYVSGLGINENNLYWGHRYPALSLSNYDNMKVYKVSFYARDTGSYKVYVYNGTTSDHPQTQLLQQTFFVGSTGWFDIDLSTPIQIDASKDLWVFIYDPECKSHPATYCGYSGSEGNYYSTDPTSWVNSLGNIAFLIRTFVTDGAYTYNVYRDGSCIANQVSGTSYSDTNLMDGVYSYYVKTNYYGGETEASNQITVEIGNPTLTLAINADNNSAINVAAGQLYNVVLADRTLYKGGIWNTLCLPFNLNDFTGTPLEGAIVKTLAGSTYNDDVLTINFTNALTAIEAGKPYIIKWDATDPELVNHSDAFTANVNNGMVPKTTIDSIVNPMFYDVTINSATANITTTYADFIGSYAPFSDAGLLLDDHNPNGNAQHAALGISDPIMEGYIFGGWYIDAELTIPATTIPFVEDGTVTLYASQTSTVTQTVALTVGTNWFSTNVEITLDDLQAALEDALPNASNITIKSQRNGQTSYNGSSWRGALNTLDVALMYKIEVDESCEISLYGVPIDPAEHPITIKNGPNWIGFPIGESISPTDAFAGFAIGGDILRSKTQQASYSNSWRGALNTLVPGQGYIYNSSATNDRILTFLIGAK